MFSRTTRWSDACILVNRLEASSFPLLLQRLSAKLHKAEHPFSEAERGQLCEFLSLDEHRLVLLLDACSFAFQQAIANNCSASKLRAELMQAGFDTDKAESFATVWEETAPQFVQQLKDRAAISPLHLQSVDWRLQCTTATSDGARIQEPHCVMQLHLSEPKPQGQDAHRSVHMQLDEAQLKDLLHTLDAVQANVDRLG